jgi:hypothetical protein
MGKGLPSSFISALISNMPSEKFGSAQAGTAKAARTAIPDAIIFS